MWADLWIQHGLSELASSTYGRVLAFYHRDRTLAAPYETVVEDIMKEKTAKSYLSLTQKRLLNQQLDQVPAQIRAAFDKAFAAWKSTWFRGGLALNSNPQARAIGPEYDALIALGSPILPLVVEQLAEPENFMALQLYDAIQPDANLLVQFEPDDERILEGEQGRAQRVVKAWFANR
jgi:hypothetical protein